MHSLVPSYNPTFARDKIPSIFDKMGASNGRIEGPCKMWHDLCETITFF